MLDGPMQPAVFLDRDNTLIANDGDLGDPAQVELLEGVAEGLRRLRQAGYRLVVITNQGGVARGKYTEDDVDAVHLRIAVLADQSAGMARLIDRFYYCPFHPEASVEEYRRDHPWRKPSPGMLLQAARDLDLDLSRSWVIGDQDRDIAAGRAAGCRSVLVSGNGDLADSAQPTAAVASFREAVDVIVDATEPVEPSGGGGSDETSLGAASAGNFGNGDDGPPAAASIKANGGGGGHGPSASSLRELDDSIVELRRSIREFADEMRRSQSRTVEFTGMRLAAALGQLGVILLAVLGLLHLETFQAFIGWFAGAILAQLLVLALLVLDLKP